MVAFIALYLLAQGLSGLLGASWAAQHLAALQHPLANRGIETTIILHTLLVPLASISAALGLLWRTRWALGLTLTVFVLQAVGFMLYTGIYACNVRIWPMDLYNVPPLLSMLAGLATIGILAVYLLRHARPPAAR
ncbi:MAG TPA: hypothetical protein VGL77_17260 [Armatimonadota bacterium]